MPDTFVYFILIIIFHKYQLYIYVFSEISKLLKKLAHEDLTTYQPNNVSDHYTKRFLMAAAKRGDWKSIQQVDENTGITARVCLLLLIVLLWFLV